MLSFQRRDSQIGVVTRLQRRAGGDADDPATTQLRRRTTAIRPGASKSYFWPWLALRLCSAFLRFLAAVRTEESLFKSAGVSKVKICQSCMLLKLVQLCPPTSRFQGSEIALQPVVQADTYRCNRIRLGCAEQRHWARWVDS